MDAYISKGKAFGTVTVPPSKSLTHRALICGALAGIKKEEIMQRNAGDVVQPKVKTEIFPMYNSEDIKTTIRCLEKLGAVIKIDGERAVVERGISLTNTSHILDCRESGSTLRFLMPVCLALGIPATFTGTGRLFQRPMSVYEDICRAQGISFKRNGCSITVEGRISGSDFTIPADISSQFISGLLMSIPLLETPGELIFSTKPESLPYVMLTIDIMKEFGIKVLPDLENDRITIDEGQRYSSPGTVYIEGDYSSAAFLDSFNYLGGKVSLTCLKEDSLQGDKIYREYFNAIAVGRPVLDVSQCPDLAPILMVLGAANNGVTLTSTGRLKLKESDRGKAMAEELGKFGIRVDVDADSISVGGSQIRKLEERISTHNDHRIAMALSILCTLTGGVIENCRVVEKSFPDFYDTLSALGIQVRIA